MTRASRPCAEPGCPALVASGPRCPDHTVARYKDSEQARYYSSAEWKNLRAQVRTEEPICRLCRTAPTTSVDHIDGDWRNGARSNLRGLCTDCERTRTARQHRRLRDDARPRLVEQHASEDETPPQQGWCFA